MAERDANGKFLPGHRVGLSGGRPPRKVEEEYIRAFSSTVTAAEWKAVIRKAVAKAKAGDARAREWLSDYLVGRPLQREGLGVGNGDNPYITATDDELKVLAKQIAKNVKP